MGIAERIGGLPSLTAALVICSGVAGAALGPVVLDLVRVQDMRARGLAIGDRGAWDRHRPGAFGQRHRGRLQRAGDGAERAGHGADAAPAVAAAIGRVMRGCGTRCGKLAPHARGGRDVGHRSAATHPRTRLCHRLKGCPEGRAAAHWDLARRLEEEREDYLDEEGAETFPASDPPSHVPITGDRV